MMREPPPRPGPCPNCGKPEGAWLGSTSWGHDHSCCSPECGIEFRDSPKRARLELERLRAERAEIDEQIDRWRLVAGEVSHEGLSRAKRVRELQARGMRPGQARKAEAREYAKGARR